MLWLQLFLPRPAAGLLGPTAQPIATMPEQPKINTFFMPKRKRAAPVSQLLDGLSYSNITSTIAAAASTKKRLLTCAEPNAVTKQVQAIAGNHAHTYVPGVSVDARS